MLFSLLQVSWATNIQNNEVILKTYSIVDTSTKMRRFVQDFFSSSIDTSDRYIQQIDRAMKTFYNFYDFHILGIGQFKFNSLIVLLHILSQSTCLNRLISIEYKNKRNILIASNRSCTSDRSTFWPILENKLFQ